MLVGGLGSGVTLAEPCPNTSLEETSRTSRDMDVNELEHPVAQTVKAGEIDGLSGMTRGVLVSYLSDNSSN